MAGTRKKRERSATGSDKERSKKKVKGISSRSSSSTGAGKENVKQEDNERVTFSQKDMEPPKHAGAGNKPINSASSGEPKPKEKAAAVKYDDSDLDNRIPNGFEMYAVWNRDSKFHPVIILESKPNDNHRSEPITKSTSKSRGVYDFGKHGYNYYVHFLEFDRRMDEWVTRSQLRLEKELLVMEKEENYFLKENVEVNEDDHHGHSQAEHQAHEEATKVKNLNSIVFGKYEMETWYFSPFPPEFGRFTKLLFCEYCLKFFGYAKELERHQKKCTLRHPPGDEIYRSKEQGTTIAAFEVDGARETIYCENLCLIAKLFLDHKTLFYDTKIFLFYIVCELDEEGFHIVGYFSKEKDADHTNNLACILTLPCHQRKGYGRFLISLSYGLSKLEKKAGTPEKPLSDLGRVSYESYWSEVIVKLLGQHDPEEPLSIEDISRETGIIVSDLCHTLELLNLLRYEQGEHVFEITDEIIAKFSQKDNVPPDRVHVRPCIVSKLHWTPFLSLKDAKRQRNR